MAQINGQPGAEKELLKQCPDEINCFDDVKPLHAKYKNDLEQTRTTFFEKLPDAIKKEKEKLSDTEKKRQDVEDYWNVRINNIRKSIEDNKWMIWKYIDLFFKEHFSKPGEIRIADINIAHQKSVVYNLENNPEDVFQEEQTYLVSKINHLDSNVKSSEYQGAYGELKVLNELKKLDDNYHVLCDVKINLRKWITYKGKRNLGSAQLDFVVVGSTGIFVIEVKNWGSNQVKYHSSISPHEQVDRAGLALWVYLKNRTRFFKPHVTKVLVPIRHNLQYNPYYKSVLIRDPQNLRKFIVENRNTLSERRINKVTSILRRC